MDVCLVFTLIMLSFLVRAGYMSLWLFIGWVALRVWELNFEVSPLPAILLPITTFLALFVWAFFLGRRVQKNHPLELAYRYWAVGLLVGGALLWEFGFSLWMSGWSSLGSLVNARFFLGILVQAAGVWMAGMILRHAYGKQHPATRQDLTGDVTSPSSLTSDVASPESPRSPEGTQS